MNITLAAFHLVHDFPGGAVALGPMVGKNPATLSHEVNPHYTTAKLGLEDAVKLSQLSADLRILNSFAAQLDCMVVPLGGETGTSGGIEAVADLAREFSELVQAFSEAVRDDRVTGNELKRVEAEASHLVASVQRAVRHVNAMAEREREQRAVPA
jgi:hypothetical protein